MINKNKIYFTNVIRCLTGIFVARGLNVGFINNKTYKEDISQLENAIDFEFGLAEKFGLDFTNEMLRDSGFTFNCWLFHSEQFEEMYKGTTEESQYALFFNITLFIMDRIEHSLGLFYVELNEIISDDTEEDDAKNKALFIRDCLQESKRLIANN